MSAWPGRRQPTPDERAQLTADIIASQQVTAFCAHRTAQADINVAKRRDLRERNGKPRRRRILEDPGDRMRKCNLETGYDSRRDLFLAEPLEPWTCEYPAPAKRAYTDLMRGVPGTDLLENWDGVALDALPWMRDEELVTISEDRLRVVPLSDEAARVTRRYPGALVIDTLARYGRQLRDQASGLVMAAFVNICAGKSRKRGRKPGIRTASGIRLAARELCAEANRIKARRPDLDGYRYLSVDTCRRVIRGLLGAGLLTELEAPRAVRERRSWKTVPRLFEVAMTAMMSPGMRPAPT